MNDVDKMVEGTAHEVMMVLGPAINQIAQAGAARWTRAETEKFYQGLFCYIVGSAMSALGDKEGINLAARAVNIADFAQRQGFVAAAEAAIETMDGDGKIH